MTQKPKPEMREILTRHKEQLRETLSLLIECVSNKSKRILFQIYHDLKHKADYCLRREGILRVVNSKKTHMATIVEFISRKYNIENINELTITKLDKIQHEYLMRQIETKPLHSILFQYLKDTEVNVNESAGWLVHGNNSARTEGMCCSLQDRNLFFDNGENKCNHCNSAKKTVDHLATRCGRMLNSSYLRRHNEVVKCLHLHLCRQYGIRKMKKLKTHSVQSVVANEIRVDTTISTDTAVSKQ
ncbi:uncharacterized protein LOC115231939 [Octopus sinensis]|uniref:Uncharacterized protein LOC115231939 n=1 Tax=Octopus sinensis TaxID=2607531 RepID=A0A6P7U8G8_9MOLL|nr:uncharacterized protein LOC115231939 [Octopus sinensis]